MSHRNTVLVGFSATGKRRDFRNSRSYDTAVAMKKMRDKGATLEQIGYRYHVSRQAVEQRLMKLEWVQSGLGGVEGCL